jgi:hypothetical protein
MLLTKHDPGVCHKVFIDSGQDEYMKKLIIRFFEVCEQKGYDSAIKIMFNWLIGLFFHTVYQKAGLGDFIRYQLGLGSGSVSDAVYIGLYRPLLKKNRVWD